MRASMIKRNHIILQPTILTVDFTFDNRFEVERSLSLNSIIVAWLRYILLVNSFFSFGICITLSVGLDNRKIRFGPVRNFSISIFWCVRFRKNIFELNRLDSSVQFE